MTFQAYCPDCKKTVGALTILKTSELKRALEADSDVRVMHPTPKGDHVWTLDKAAKINLQKAIAEGLLH
jgi:hypothetical protein